MGTSRAIPAWLWCHSQGWTFTSDSLGGAAGRCGCAGEDTAVAAVAAATFPCCLALEPSRSQNGSGEERGAKWRCFRVDEMALFLSHRRKIGQESLELLEEILML